MARDIPAKTRKKVRERDKDECQNCHGSGTEIHHIIFKSQAPKAWVHDERNLVLLCTECHKLPHNFRKWRKHWEDWQQRRFGTEWQIRKGIIYKASS
jgi:5-methylcytosine-specific restriction endonuclease McrA